MSAPINSCHRVTDGWHFSSSLWCCCHDPGESLAKKIVLLLSRALEFLAQSSTDSTAELCKLQWPYFSPAGPASTANGHGDKAEAASPAPSALLEGGNVGWAGCSLGQPWPHTTLIHFYTGTKREREKSAALPKTTNSWALKEAERGWPLPHKVPPPVTSQRESLLRHNFMHLFQPYIQIFSCI